MSERTYSLSILLVEDNPADRKLTEIALHDAAVDGRISFEMASAATLAEADAHLGGGGCDVVLLDLNLPDAKGLDGVRRLHAAHPATPIVVLTGLSDDSVTVDALAAGASDFLEKSDLRPHTLIRALRFAVERKSMERKLVRLAETDPLTGLLNRRAFLDMLAKSGGQSDGDSPRGALALLDLDRFKDINDIFGHNTGDEVLVSVGETIRDGLGPNDLAARLGGDEFAILLGDAATSQEAMDRTNEILRALKAIHSVRNGRFAIDFSIGVSMIPSADAEPGALMTRADLALYKSKQAHDDRVTIYDSEMDTVEKMRCELKRQMATDIDEGRFFMVFQPIVDAHDYSIVGAEALARWNCRNGRLVSPDTFIPIAEESGLISLLSKKLFTDLCQCLRDCLDIGKKPLPIAVNISSMQCRDPGFAVEFIGAMERMSIPPNLINMELTETALVQNLATVKANLDTLRRYGVGVQIDDFGTGYSSLSLLKELTFDAVKIDRSFIRDVGCIPWADAVVKAVVDMSRVLGFRVVAEGIETDEQAKALRDLGVGRLQGYRFSRPVSREDLLTMLPESKASLSA